MQLSEDIIVDLLPSYFAGEASPATRVIVDDYFHAHPRFAHAMRASQQVGLPHDPVTDSGKEVMQAVRRRLKSRAMLLALALFCSVSPFTFIIQEGVLTYAMWRDSPVGALCYTTLAVFAWGALWKVDRADGPA